MAGIAISKMPNVSLLKKKVDYIVNPFSFIVPVLPNYHSQGIGLVPGAAWFYIKCFVKFMHDGKEIGTLEKTEKNKVVVN